ncbi:MAG: type II CRISPR-associated endonuclease Cas1 [Bacilli bacterium]
MSWRVVVISKRAKLEYKMNYLVIRDEEVVKVHLSEINTLLIESTAVSLTTMLISKLQERKIKVIFCDCNRNPETELTPYYGCHNSVEKIRSQINWDDEYKKIVWTAIVKEKITNQANTIKSLKPDSYQLLMNYVDTLELNDPTNREAHAAKVYFNAMFGSKFNRKEKSGINAALNYGYTIILSAINREIACCGYLTQLGISHDNMFNPFNLSSDLIEPLRPLIDNKVCSWGEEYDEFTPSHKIELINLLNEKVKFDNKRFHFLDALGDYVKSIFRALESKDESLIRFIAYD